MRSIARKLILMNKQLSGREKLILYVLIAVTFLGANVLFVFEPVIRRNITLNNEIQNVNLRIKRYLALLGKEKFILDNYNKLNLDSPELLGRQDRVVSLLSELEDTAKNAGIQIIEIRPEAGSKKGKRQETVVNLKAEAAMEQYVKFIYDLENSRFLLRIKSLQLSVKSNSQALEGVFSITANPG